MPNRAVYALFCAISMQSIGAPSIRLNALRLPPSSRTATFSLTPISLAFATAASTIFCASSEEMLYFLTTLDIGDLPLRAFLDLSNRQFFFRLDMLCYLVYPLGMERNMPPDLHNSTKRILVRPRRIDGLLSSNGNAIVIAIAFIGTVGNVIGPLQLGKVNVRTWNVLNGRIRSFTERQGVASICNHAARNGYDSPSGIALDGYRMIRTWKFELLIFHVSVSSLPVLS